MSNAAPALPDRYALEGEDPLLGEGGMGRVYRARDRVLGVPVALKVVRPALAEDARFRKLFDLEVRMAARFTHPHIVPLHDLGALADGTPFLGLALADAGNLGRYKREPIGWDDLLRYALELLDALAHLHSRGVLHRDLKPENVLLHLGGDGRRHVWLADLGLANAATSLAKRKGGKEGTPGFMAPEQRLGLVREYGPWTDLYAVGVILWELVTSELPFDEGRSALDADLPPLVPRAGLKIPVGLELVLANLLSAEPLSRYDLAADLRTELLALGPPTLGSADEPPPRRLLGTIAESAPPPTPLSSGTPSAPESNRTLLWEGAGEDQPGFDLGVPVWNRPRPPLLGVRVPEDRGLGARARASLPLFALRELPVVARDAYRQRLWDQACAVAADGQPRVVVLVGEAGSGKSHLVQSVLRLLEEHGWAETVAMSYQRPAGQEDGYAGAARALIRPWNETRGGLEQRLRRRIARSRGLNDAITREEAATLARWAGLLHVGEEPVAAGYGLREVHRELDARAWRGLSVLWLDDVQWAIEEGDGLAIPEALLQAAGDGVEKRVLCVATLRSEDLAQDRALQAEVDNLVAAGAVRIDLPRLDRQGTEAVLAESLTLAPALAAKVAERCEGNPLFARQLLLEWTARGWLVDTGHLVFGLADGVDVDAVLPADADALFRDRVAALAEGSGDSASFLDLVHLAGLGGQTLPLPLFTALAGEGLGAYARGCGLWVAAGEDLVTFDHGLLYQSVRSQAEARDDAAALHARLAEAWRSYGQATGSDVYLEVGRHAHAGRQWKEAAKALLRAAERAWSRGWTRTLAEAAELAVDACVHGLPQRLGWAMLWFARATQAQGDAARASELYAAALSAFEEASDEPGALEALVGLGIIHRERGELAQAEARLTAAMKRARTAKDVRHEAAAIAELAWLEQKKRNFSGAEILFTRVLNRFNGLNDARGAAEATLGMAFVARRTGDFDDAEQLYGEAIELFQQGEDLLGVARARGGLAMVRRQRLQLNEAEALFREAVKTAEELGAVGLLMDARSGLADLHRMRGDGERARAVYEAHARWAERKGIFDAAIFAHLSLAHLALLDDDLQRMYQHAHDAAVHLEKVPGHWLWASYRLVVATLLALRDDEDQAYRWLWSAQDLGLDDVVDQDVAYFLTVLCHVAGARRWVNTTRVAAKLAWRQWSRLGRPREADRINKVLEKVLGPGARVAG